MHNFSSHPKSNYLSLRCMGKLSRYKLSIIYKHIQAMHNELRYQAKTHAIFEKLSKGKKNKILHLLHQFFFFFFFFMKNNKNKL
jgi:hypothetical protein